MEDIRPTGNAFQGCGQKRENIRWLAAMGYEVGILPDPSMSAEDPFWIKEVKHCI